MFDPKSFSSSSFGGFLIDLVVVVYRDTINLISKLYTSVVLKSKI